MFLSAGVKLVFLFFFVFLLKFIEATDLRSIVLRYACASTATRSYLTNYLLVSVSSFILFLSCVFLK